MKNGILFHAAPAVRALLLAASVAGAACLYAGCTSHSEGASVTTQLDAVDALIAQGDVRSALDALKSVAKQAHSTGERLGVYKRYRTLGEDAPAERFLKQSLRKVKNSPELTAVYGAFLVRHNRLPEALRLTEKLRGGEFGSIYSECFLRYALQSGKEADELFDPKKRFKKAKKADDDASPLQRFEVFYDSRFIPIYDDAYTGSRDGAWAWNAAALEMMRGNYAVAASRYPGHIDSLADSLFWGAVLYDAGRYPESLEALGAGGGYTADAATAMEHRALSADVYYILGEDEDAERLRDELLALAAPYEADIQQVAAGSAAAYVDARIISILPLVYVNSALYARQNDDRLEAYRCLHDVVMLFPDYVPGLAAYGEYALDGLRRPPDDTMTAQIRAAGLQTRSMEQEAAVPQVPVEEVLDLVQAAASRNRMPQLVVLREELYAELHRAAENAQKAARVWPMLEQNELGPSLYPEEVMHYAVLVLLNAGHGDEARRLFDRYEKAAHPLGDEDAVFVPAEHPEMLTLWECEIAAWFAAQDARVQEATALYQFILDHYASRSPVMTASGRNSSVVNAYVNLANICSGSGRPVQALSLLNNASARAMDAPLKAEVLYRMGKESYYQRDFHSAIRSLQYAIRLNPSHNRARFTLKLVQQAQNEAQ